MIRFTYSTSRVKGYTEQQECLRELTLLKQNFKKFKLEHFHCLLSTNR